MAWREDDHPRDPEGVSTGGQFTVKAGAAAKAAAGLGTFVPFDKSKYRNIGEYMAALPKWKPNNRGPENQYIEVWYDNRSKNWVVLELDRNGYQIQSFYCYTKGEALRNAALWQNDWWENVK